MPETTTMPTPAELQEALIIVSHDLGPAWKVYENNGQPYAARRFEYLRGSAQALLSVRPHRCIRDPKKYLTAEPLDLVRMWKAQVDLPFSAGAELALHGKLVEVGPWTKAVEQALCLPFRVRECRSPEAGEWVFAGVSGKSLVLLCAVFDIDPGRGRERVVRDLVQRCMSTRRAA